MSAFPDYAGSIRSSGRAQVKKQIQFTLFKINLDPNNKEEPNFQQKKLQIRIFGGKQLNLLGKTETKCINSKKPSVSLAFATPFEIPNMAQTPELKIVLLCEGKQFGIASVTTKDLEEGKQLRKKFRNTEAKVIQAPFVALDVTTIAMPAAPQILLPELEFEEKIGEGSFGIVYKGMCRGSKVAIKKLANASPTDLEDFINEMIVMREAPHPKLLLLMGVCFDENSNTMYAVSELMAGDLYKLLIDPNSKQKTNPENIITMAIDAAHAIMWLHERQPPILHRDIKPSNILHDTEYRIKVCDLGMSTEVKPDAPERIGGSPSYMAPELLQFSEAERKGASSKSDVYAFAITLWEMVSQTPVYPELRHGTLNEFRTAIIEGKRPPLDPSWPKDFQKLLTDMWDPNPENRPEFKEIITRLNTIYGQFIYASIEIHLGPVATKFWIDSFRSAKTISFSKFVHHLYPYLSLVTPTDKYLIAIQYDKEENTRRPAAALSGASEDQVDNFRHRYPNFSDEEIRAVHSRDGPRTIGPQAYYATDCDTDPERVLSCLSLYLCGEERLDRKVTIDKFGDLIRRFGPIEPGNPSLLTRFETIARKRYFFGSIANPARYLQTDTSFLVRTSQGNPTGLTLEYCNHARKIFSIRLTRNPDGSYTIPTTATDTFTHTDLDELIIRFFNPIDRDEFLRQHPAPNSPYGSVWETTDSHRQVGYNPLMDHHP